MSATTAGPVLVIGSYPPVRVPGAEATLAVVRQQMAAGEEVIVASPRASAARYDVPVSGIFAGRRLRHLQALTGARRLVVSAERELPVPTRFAVPSLLGALQRRTLAELRRAAAGFDAVTIVLVDDLGLPAPVQAGLVAMAGEVVDQRGQWRGDARVSVLGPDDQSPAEQAMALSRKLGRRALGPLAPRVRPVLVRVARRAGL